MIDKNIWKRERQISRTEWENGNIHGMDSAGQADSKAGANGGTALPETALEMESRESVALRCPHCGATHYLFRERRTSAIFAILPYPQTNSKGQRGIQKQNWQNLKRFLRTFLSYSDIMGSEIVTETVSGYWEKEGNVVGLRVVDQK